MDFKCPLPRWNLEFSHTRLFSISLSTCVSLSFFLATTHKIFFSIYFLRQLQILVHLLKSMFFCKSAFPQRKIKSNHNFLAKRYMQWFQKCLDSCGLKYSK
ncbi:hypothetical protein ACB092_08G018700 [Castanea dentata]